MEIDAIDRAILMALQRDGRLSNVMLSEEVALSESACLRRVKLLEKNGLIDRYAMLCRCATGYCGSVLLCGKPTEIRGRP